MKRTPKSAGPVVMKSCPACGWIDGTGKRNKCRRCFALLEVASAAHIAHDAQLATARAHREPAPAPEPVAPLMRGFNPFAWWRA